MFIVTGDTSQERNLIAISIGNSGFPAETLLKSQLKAHLVIFTNFTKLFVRAFLSNRLVTLNPGLVSSSDKKISVQICFGSRTNKIPFPTNLIYGQYREFRNFITKAKQTHQILRVFYLISSRFPTLRFFLWNVLNTEPRAPVNLVNVAT